MRILVTRPQPDGERTAAALRGRGHEVLLAPLLRVEAVHADPGPGPFAAVLITSANAARAMTDHPRRAELLPVPVFAVGDASAQAAREAGFADVVSAGGDAGDLARLVSSRGISKIAPLLYLAGEDRAGDLAGDLAQTGLTARTVVVYRAVALALPPQAAQALSAGSIDAVLHFSRRSAALYLKGTAAAGVQAQALAPVHYCFAPQTAAVLTAAGATRTVVAPRPDEAALFAVIG